MLNPIWNALIFFSTAHNQQLYAHAQKNGFTISSCHHIHHWLVVWKYEFYFSIYWESSSRLTFIFFRGAGTPPTSCYHAISTLWYIWYCKEWCIYYIYVYTCIDHIRHFFIISSPCLKRRQEIKPPLAPSTDGVLLDSPESLGQKNEVLKGCRRYTHQYPDNSSMCLWYANRCMIIGIEDMFMK